MSLQPITKTGTTKEQRQHLVKTLNKAGVFEYRQNSSYKPKYAAQSALAGKSHYVEDSTLGFFRAKVLDAGPICNGLFYFIRESKDHSNDFDRVHNYVYFDVWGNIVEKMRQKAKDDECYTSAQVAKSEQAVFDVDPIDYYTTKLRDRSRRAEKEANDFRFAADVIVGLTARMNRLEAEATS
tara:strand:+ start:253 stop:798 length:546 start_codon:yes stop_codon:yes gene_type:complete